MMSDFLRPNRVAQKPDNALPIIQPSNALEEVIPCMTSV